MYCNYCGTKNKDDMRFCVKCGKPLPSQEDDPAAAPVPVTAAPATPAAPVQAAAGATAATEATAAAAAAAAAKSGFLASAGGKVALVAIAAAVLTAGGFGVKYLIDKNSDEGREDKHSKKHRTEETEDETEETEESIETVETETAVETEAVPEPVEIDLFDYVDVKFYGYSPSITATVVVHDDLPVSGVAFVLSKYEGIANGETVTATISGEAEGYVFSSMTREFTAEGPERVVNVYDSGRNVQFVIDYDEYYEDVPVPAVEITGHDMSAVNEEIFKACEEGVHIEGDLGYGHEDFYAQTFGTSSYISDKTVTIFIAGAWGMDYGNAAYRAIYISIETGEIIDKDTFLSLEGMSRADFDQKVLSLIDQKIDENPAGMAWDENTSAERIASAVPFYTTDGRMCFSVLIKDTTVIDYYYFPAYVIETGEEVWLNQIAGIPD